MKKLAALMLAVCIAAAFSACGQTQPPVESIATEYIVESVVRGYEQLPPLQQVTDNEQANEFFLLDLTNANYNEISLYHNPTSGTLAELIVINAKDAGSAIADLESRRSKLINTDAFYPNDKAIAENSVIDSVGSYVYFIALEDPAPAETIIRAELERLDQ
jgi:hypothetical protein